MEEEKPLQKPSIARLAAETVKNHCCQSTINTPFNCNKANLHKLLQTTTTTQQNNKQQTNKQQTLILCYTEASMPLLCAHHLYGAYILQSVRKVTMGVDQSGYAMHLVRSLIVFVCLLDCCCNGHD
jgi:hypothetical protein